MKTEKFHTEYLLDNVSLYSLWRCLSTKAGLEEWFADEVRVYNKHYDFKWGKDEIEKAEAVDWKKNTLIRFKWIGDEIPEAYMEFIIHTNELTGSVVIEITDYLDPDERDDSIELWNNNIEKLKRTLGL